MAYRIQYNSGVTRTDYTERGKQRPHNAIWIITLCLVIVFMLFSYADHIRSFLIPGNDTLTVAALSNLESNIRNGVSIKEAFFEFCSEILEDAA